MIKRFLLYFISISALPGLVFWLFYQSDIKSHEHLFEHQETTHVDLQSKTITSYLQKIESDLTMISSLLEFRQLAESHKDYSSKELEDDFLSISLRKGIYDQIRFIGKTGQEILRINYNKGKPIVVPKDQLQNKIGRYYFKKTMNLNKEKVYVSPLDLNFEKGEVEKPFKPVIRFGSPIFNSQNEKKGVLILNFFAQFMIDSFKNNEQDSVGQTHLLNSDGYWLSSPNPEDEWGFMLEERKNKAFSDNFPVEWTTILKEETGQFSSRKGLFTFKTLYPIMETVKLKRALDNTQRVSVSGEKTFFWKIVSFVPQETLYQVLKEESKNLQNTFLMLYAFLGSLIGAGAFLFLKASEQKRKAEELLHQKAKFIQLVQEITITGNEAPTAEEAIQVCIDKVCKYMNWPVGHVYITDSTGTLISSKKWHIENAEQFNAFRKITEDTTFDKGVGLPGQVMATGKPAWITDVTHDQNFPRAILARDIGVKAAFALPVLEGEKVVAVLEFFAGEALEPDDPTLEALSNLAVQIGRVTERKRSENELHRLQKAIEQADETIMITDIDGNIQYVNPAFEKITGYKKIEVIGQNPRILQGGKQDKQFYNKMWATLKQGDVWSGHFINKRKDGAIFEEDATISPVFGDSDNIINYVAVKRDVSKEIMLESQLRQSQKLEAVGTLAGGIAHDFNNILTSIIGYTELSISSLPEDSKTSDYLSNVLNSSCRARDLIKQILTFSREIEKNMKPLELSSVVKEVLKLMKASLPSTIKICSNMDKRTGNVVADLTQMHQLIMNLCVNAEHAMREKGGILEINLDSVNVDADLALVQTNLKEGPYIKLTVRDTGHGMDKKIAERIFDPFFTTKKVGEGTGMGLTTVHGIVLSHGGEITINSEPGKGTTFKVYLPKADTTPIKDNLKTQLIPRGSEKILLVDDEKAVLNPGQKILENLGYNVVAKDNSLVALKAFKADPKKFDIVITDQTMPDMTGDALASELMSVRHDIPVILCTGFSHLITNEKAKTIGIKKLIMKPFSVREIALAVREALDNELKFVN